MELDLIRRSKCPCCGRAIGKAPAYKLEKFDVYDCPVCKVRFIDPSLTADQQMFIYQDSATLREINPALENYYEYDTCRPGTRTYKDYVDALSRCEWLAKGRALLEIGCGKGAFLKLAKARGWDVAGIDSSEENVSSLKADNIRAICGDIFTYRPDRLYDVIVLWDVIEHPQDPAALLKKCREWLAKDGLLVIAAPCFPNLLSLIAGLFYRISGGLVKGPLRSLYILEHTSYFSPSNLGRLLAANGLRGLACWKTETDLSRYKFRTLTRFALRMSFWIARCLRLQTRAICISRKSND